MGVVDVQTKLRVALGTLKDQVSIGKAMISNRDHDHHELGKTFSDIEIAVLRATSHDNGPIDDKHMHQILFLVSNAPATAGSVPFLTDCISRRLSKTKDPLVALKTLLLVHRLLRGGNTYFEHQLRGARISGHLQISSSHQLSLPESSFLHKYAAYLEERIGWAINQGGKLEPAPPNSYSHHYKTSSSIGIIFHKLPKCQIFIDKVLDCLPMNYSYSDDNSNSNINLSSQAAVLKESFQVYMTYCEGVSVLVNVFLDLTTAARALACRILKTASQQTLRLHKLYENYKRVLDNKNLKYPTVQIISMEHVMALEHLSNCQLPITKFIGKEGHGEKKLETKISKVWVVFEDEDDNISS